MTRLVLSGRAWSDLERLTDFLLESIPQEAERTADMVFEALEILLRHPEIGRPFGKGLRELVISRGRTGYLALYRYDETRDVVLVIALRHQREAGFRLH